jgi:hypothetical protein
MTDAKTILIQQAYNDILARFAELGTPPNGMRANTTFLQLRLKFSGGLFQAAFKQLVDDGFVVVVQSGRFWQLTDAGFEAAHSVG